MRTPQLRAYCLTSIGALLIAALSQLPAPLAANASGTTAYDDAVITHLAPGAHAGIWRLADGANQVAQPYTSGSTTYGQSGTYDQRGSWTVDGPNRALFPDQQVYSPMPESVCQDSCFGINLPAGNFGGMAVWYKPVADGQQDYSTGGVELMRLDPGSCAGTQPLVTMQSGLILHLSLPQVAGDVAVGIAAGYWYYIVVTYDPGAGSYKLWVNGKSIGSIAGPATSGGWMRYAGGGPVSQGGACQAPALGEYSEAWWTDGVYGNTVSTEAAIWQDYSNMHTGPGPTAAAVAGGGNPDTKSTCGCKADPVNSGTGEFYHSFTDLAIPGRGIPLSFTRTYASSAAAQNGPLGYGWTDNYNASLTTDPGTGNVTVRAENSSSVTFTAVGGNYVPPAWVLASLVKNGDGTFTYSRMDQMHLTFSAAGQLTKETERNGYATTFAYTSGKLSSVTEPAGRQLLFTYGTNGLLSKVTDPASRSVSFLYDTSGNLTSATDVATGVTTFTYDPNHLLLTMTDPRHGVTTNTYDPQGRVLTQKDQLNRVTTFSYVPSGTTITDPKGNVTVDTYENNKLVSRTQGAGTLQAVTWTYGYDVSTFGRNSVTDPNGHVTSSSYDARGNLLSSTDALQRVTSYTYDSLNDPLTVTDPLKVATTNTYDASGNLLSTARPLTGTSQTATTTYSYDPLKPGDMIKMTDPDVKVWQYAYDTYGNRSKTIDPLTDTTTFAYDTVGRMTSRVSPKGNVKGGKPATYTTKYTDNPFGDVLTVTDPLAHVTTNQYDANRNLTSVKDADSNTTTYVYDAANQQTQVTRADSTTQITDYNPDGTVLDQKDGKNNAILTYGYDSLARVSTSTDALGNVTSYSYDGAGNRLTQQDPGGNCLATPAVGCTSFGYDVANQLKSIIYSDNVTPNVSNITYDADGQRTGITDGTGTSTWAWDSLHRLTSYTNGVGAQVQYAYNLRNLATTITYPGALNVIRGYDDAGRMTTVQDWLSNTTTFGYDVNSNLTTETLPAASAVVDTFTFDAADRLMAIADKKGNSSLFGATYTRDNANQLTSDSSQPSATKSYKYTTLNQVCYAGSASTTACTSPPSGSIPYKYDAADNLTQSGPTQQVFNGADELCWTGSATGSCASPPSGATTYGYDTRGNRTTITPPAGGPTTLTYDQANRLTAYGTAGTYTYNGDGLRMSKAAGGTTSQFLWDPSGGLPLMIKDGSTAYVHGPGGLPLEQISGSAALWLHHDELGSSRLVTSSAGSSVATYTFDAYGNLSAVTGSATNPLRFAGQYFDGESGMYYLRARYYEPNLGQFITRDPLTHTTRQPYSYAADDPLNTVDPTGLVCFQFWDPAKCNNAATPLIRWSTTPISLPNDRLITGPINVLVGGYKVLSGVAAFAVGTVVEVFVPILGLTIGVPAQLYGSYQVVTGISRSYRGMEQMDSARKEPTVCKTPIQWGLDALLDVAPGGGAATNFLGGLP